MPHNIKRLFLALTRRLNRRPSVDASQVIDASGFLYVLPEDANQ